MKRIYFTVINDLIYDRRMDRICTSLQNNGYEVVLVGRREFHIATEDKCYRQLRVRCIFNTGPLMYIEFNIRLLIVLLRHRMDAICAVDLDTIVPCILASSWRKKKRIYDAHEYFTGLTEVFTRPSRFRFWRTIEQWALPKFKHGYSVSESISSRFEKDYGVCFTVIRNLPVKNPLSKVNQEGYLYYGGAVNEGRGFEYLIPAMKNIDARLVIAGSGNFFERLKKMIGTYQLENKITLLGMLPPDELDRLSCKATLGIGLIENAGPNQYMALPNKFFDYIQCGCPQLTMDYPEIRKINAEFEVAVLLNSLDPETIAKVINDLLKNKERLQFLRENCLKAREIYNWQNEESKLVQYYNEIFA